MIQAEQFKVKLTLLEPLLGTVPKQKEVYAKYIAAKAPEPEQAEANEGQDINETEEKGWTGFHTDAEGPYLLDYQIKGFLKEAGNILKEQVKVKALKSKLDNHLFITPRKIRLPDIEAEPLERPLRAMTMQGPRMSLARSDVVSAGAEIEFTIQLLKHKELSKKLVETLFEYGQLKGLGQFRNGGYGRFEAEILPT